MATISNVLEILLVFILKFCLILAEWNTKDFMKREHSLIKPYQGSGTAIPYWDFLGSSMVTNNYIRLTPDQQSKEGALWNNVPVRIKSWELHLQLKIHGKGKGELFGDGMAIWYTKQRMEQGPVFGSRDYFSGLGVFIDTYSNHNGPHNHAHPYVSAMINNGSLHYDHDRDGTHTELAGCEAKLRALEHDTHIAIRYIDDTLSVMLDIDNKHAWKPCFEVKGVQLPTGYYFGFSSATGQLADNHDVIGVKLYQLDDDQGEDRSHIIPQANSFAAPRSHSDDEHRGAPMSGWKLFALVFCGILGIIICVVVGIVVFEKRRENSRKRFY